jgi:hypothetical protein
MVATTFAWVGIFTYANTEKFQINLKVQELDSNYFLTISSDGKNFGNEVPVIDIERQIVSNIYDKKYDNESDISISHRFDEIKLSPVTTLIGDNNKLTTFEKIDFNSGQLKFINGEKDVYKFDLYLSVDTKEGITSNTTGIKANVFLTDLKDTLVGSLGTGKFNNSNPFNELPSNPINDLLKNIPDKFTVNSKNAARFALSMYKPINVNSDYDDSIDPLRTIIFQGGNETPSYDSASDSYDLGGCLDHDLNTALQELKVVRPYYVNSSVLYNKKLKEAQDRNDLEITEENSKIWDKQDHLNDYLGCMDGIQTKMKISVCFWFEGWDADCLNFIVRQPVTLNLSFTAGSDI